MITILLPDLILKQFETRSAADSDTNSAEKLARVRAAMQEKGAAHHLISSLDDIAWLTNLRGNDVSYNPVFLAHLLIGASSATLYVDDSRLTAPAREALAAAGTESARNCPRKACTTARKM